MYVFFSKQRVPEFNSSWSPATPRLCDPLKPGLRPLRLSWSSCSPDGKSEGAFHETSEFLFMLARYMKMKTNWNDWTSQKNLEFCWLKMVKAEYNNSIFCLQKYIAISKWLKWLYFEQLVTISTIVQCTYRNWGYCKNWTSIVVRRWHFIWNVSRLEGGRGSRQIVQKNFAIYFKTLKTLKIWIIASKGRYWRYCICLNLLRSKLQKNHILSHSQYTAFLICLCVGLP